jgi:hypothetical protein
MDEDASRTGDRAGTRGDPVRRTKEEDMTDKQIAPKDPEGEKKTATGEAAARVEKKSLRTKKSFRIRKSMRVRKS